MAKAADRPQPAAAADRPYFDDSSSSSVGGWSACSAGGEMDDELYNLVLPALRNEHGLHIIKFLGGGGFGAAYLAEATVGFERM
eukprot:15452519-Alexandrium_andersonii.AAC.1